MRSVFLATFNGRLSQKASYFDDIVYCWFL